MTHSAFLFHIGSEWVSVVDGNTDISGNREDGLTSMYWAIRAYVPEGETVGLSPRHLAAVQQYRVQDEAEHPCWNLLTSTEWKLGDACCYREVCLADEEDSLIAADIARIAVDCAR